VPCIERNSLGAVKAVTGEYLAIGEQPRQFLTLKGETAAQLAMSGQGTHVVSLDAVIDAMRQTARDMHSHYKETSLSGLAVSHTIAVSAHLEGSSDMWRSTDVGQDPGVHSSMLNE
jgi:L-serine deaminase